MPPERINSRHGPLPLTKEQIEKGGQEVETIQKYNQQLVECLEEGRPALPPKKKHSEFCVTLHVVCVLCMYVRVCMQHLFCTCVCVCVCVPTIKQPSTCGQSFETYKLAFKSLQG